jgi:hypothetical protein
MPVPPFCRCTRFCQKIGKVTSVRHRTSRRGVSRAAGWASNRRPTTIDMRLASVPMASRAALDVHLSVLFSSIDFLSANLCLFSSCELHQIDSRGARQQRQHCRQRPIYKWCQLTQRDQVDSLQRRLCRSFTEVEKVSDEREPAFILSSFVISLN